VARGALIGGRCRDSVADPRAQRRAQGRRTAAHAVVEGCFLAGRQELTEARRAVGLTLWLVVGCGGTVVGQPSKPCDGHPYDLAARLVGVWEELTVTPEGERLEGELRSELEAAGCAFVQEFESVDGSFTFRSLGHVDPESGHWRERFVLSTGRVALYEWVPEGADILLLRLEPVEEELFRLRVTDIGPDSYDVLEERSRDGGATWVQGERTHTRRVAP